MNKLLVLKRETSGTAALTMNFNLLFCRAVHFCQIFAFAEDVSDVCPCKNSLQSC